jgi:diguanylate cyclase (GGDEF)-like protein
MINYKKSNRLIFILSFIIALLIVINGSYSFFKMQQIKHEFYDVANRDLPLISQLLPLIDRQFEQTLLIEKLHKLNQHHRLVVLDTLEGSFIRSGKKFEQTVTKLTLFIQPMLKNSREVMRTQMGKVNKTLKKISIEHTQYHYQVIDMIESLKSNKGSYHPALMTLLNNEEVELRRELILLRDDLQRFTQESAEEVELHEDQVIQSTLLLSISSFLLGAILLIMIFKIMKSRDAATHEINYYAHYDPLTKLINRRYFFELFDQALTQHDQVKKSLHLCICDLDHFKGINDSLGHQAGDMALTSFANILSESLGEENIIGRFGGDEFIVCFTHKTQGECEFLLEKVRLILERTTFTLENDAKFSLTATFGVAHLEGKQIAQSDTNRLFEAADKALYQAKQAGRNQICILNAI